MLACIAWWFWLGTLNNKGGGGQRNCEEIGAGGFAACLRALCTIFVALPLSRAPDKTAMLSRLNKCRNLVSAMIEKV